MTHSLASVGTIVFNSIKRDLSQPSPAAAPNSNYVVRIDNKGHRVETADRVDISRKQLFNKSKRMNDHEEVKRLNTATMNRVMDKYIELPEIEYFYPWKNLPWSADKTKRFPNTEQTSFGPGHYDITLFEKGKYGDAAKAIKFSDVETGRIDSVKEVDLSYLTEKAAESIPFTASKISADRIKYKAQARAQSAPDAPIEATEYDSIIKPPSGGVKWSDDPRWAGPMFRQEPYVKTTGLDLSHDYDKVLDKRIVPKFKTGPRFVDEESLTAGLGPLNTDIWPKETISTSAMNSPVRYSAAFISTAPSGCPVIIPTSGLTVGPFSYMGAYKSSIEIKDPERCSTSFLKDRGSIFGGNEAAQDNNPAKLRNFSDMNTSGPVFSKELRGEGKGRNAHLKNILRKKLTQIYPILAKKKFSTNTGIKYRKHSKLLK